MIVDDTFLAFVSGRTPKANMRSTLIGLRARPQILGRRLQLAMCLGQLAHESGGWQYDRELWGAKPTPAQARYDSRRDLGNTPEIDGDGFRYRGRGPIQLTGRAAYDAFTLWCRANPEAAPGAPDFAAEPDRIVTDPWEGLVVPFFWEWKGLEPVAERGDVAAVTRIVNGGQKGLDDRVRYTDRAFVALADARDLRTWQTMAGLKPDGIVGPKTRSALILALRRLPDVQFNAN